MASIFMDKMQQPSEEQFETTLGNSFFVWIQIKKHLSEQYGDLTEEWKYYNSKSGWIMKLFLKKRNLLFLTVQENSFTLSLVFGDKAVAVVEQSDLPAGIKERLSSARQYAEGRGISFDVIDDSQLEIIKKLLDIKVKN
ncbi:MAG: DUF3788 domain-containing protein [Calditrichae bacterium]|nr:DUF3788 domain-containing protein [Calditrichota bacterium]MCB9059415.1 DUF3788 domain-containing protein [Calditrichia bacterium]